MLFSKVFFAKLIVLQILLLSAMLSKATSAFQCGTLQKLLPNLIFFPNSSIYDASIAFYFFVQARLQSACIVTPTSSEEISTIVKALGEIHSESPQKSLFAIQEGGHTQVVSGSNDNSGVTIDLRSINTLSLNIDRIVASFGGGSIWSEIYEQLDPMNLSVIGGRVAEVGVGGLLTGDGISALGSRYGFACDNILNMEVVLANSDIVQVNASSHSDLFRAMKGGSNNFGIVTHFDVKTIPLGDFWGGAIEFPLTNSTAQQQLEAFVTFMDPKNVDPFAEIEQAFLYFNATASFVISNDMYYTKPVVNPTALQPFADTEPQLFNTMRISNMTDFVVELASFQPVEQDGIYVTTVFPPTLSVVEQIYSLWNTSVLELLNVENVVYSLIFQRLPAILPGNSLGLYPSNTGLGLCLLSVFWDNAADAELVQAVTKKLIGEIEEVAKAAGLQNSFEYLNYAAIYQDPISSYGASLKAYLQAMNRKYDPRGLFQTGVPGGFKLFV